MVGRENIYRFCPMCGHLLEERFIDGRDRMACTDCGWIAFLNPPPVVCAVCYSEDDRIALIKRGVEPQKGYWSLPGGFMEIKESPVEACLRELREEAGISSVGQVGLISVEYQDSSRYGSVVVIGYTVQSLNPDELSPGDDAEEAEWFDVSKVKILPFPSFQRIFELWSKRYFAH